MNLDNDTTINSEIPIFKECVSCAGYACRGLTSEEFEAIKTAHWEDGAFENSKRCSVCKRYSSKISVHNQPVFDYKYCPYCGIFLGLD